MLGYKNNGHWSTMNKRIIELMIKRMKIFTCTGVDNKNIMRFSNDRPRITCGASSWFFHLNINAIMIIMAGMPKTADNKNELRHLKNTIKIILIINQK